MDIQKIKELALANGFKLKEQASGNMDLNAYVYDFANVIEQEAKAQAVPEGFVLVPKNPTHKMMEASWASLDAGSEDEWWDVYEEVMKAAQEPTND